MKKDKAKFFRPVLNFIYYNKDLEYNARKWKINYGLLRYTLKLRTGTLS